jgi:hypothetical protein
MWRNRKAVMSDIFAERLAAVRQRFAGKLDTRIDVIASAMPRLSGKGGLDALVLAHREAHGLCGIGPALGYVETGKVARLIEQILLSAIKAKRMLSDEEVPRLRDGLALLRCTATAEMHPAAS